MLSLLEQADTEEKWLELQEDWPLCEKEEKEFRRLFIGAIHHGVEVSSVQESLLLYGYVSQSHDTQLKKAVAAFEELHRWNVWVEDTVQWSALVGLDRNHTMDADSAVSVHAWGASLSQTR